MAFPFKHAWQVQSESGNACGRIISLWNACQRLIQNAAYLLPCRAGTSSGLKIPEFVSLNYFILAKMKSTVLRQKRRSYLNFMQCLQRNVEGTNSSAKKVVWICVMKRKHKSSPHPHQRDFSHQYRVPGWTIRLTGTITIGDAGDPPHSQGPVGREVVNHTRVIESALLIVWNRSSA